MKRFLFSIFAVVSIVVCACSNSLLAAPDTVFIDGDTGFSRDTVPIWPVLREDDKGSAVNALQYLLIQAGHGIGVDGDFGPATLNAVKNFQQAKGLSIDGVVGKGTWLKLVVTVGEGSTARGAIKALQYLLRYKFEYTAVSVDGVFGTITKNAVIKFKSIRNLSGGTTVGETTWLYLLGAVNSSGPSTGKWYIKITLPANRYNYGTLKLYDKNGNQIYSCSALGRSVSNASPLVYRGNTPTGIYSGYLYGPASPRDSYGPYKVIAMDGISGQIVQSGRSGIWIHGGRSQENLSPTYGCVRVFEKDQKALQDKIQVLINSGTPAAGKIEIVQN